MPVDAPGLTKQPLPTTVPWAEWQWTLFFDDVEVDESRLVGGDTGGLGALFDGLNPERIMGAAGGVGGARVALDKAVAYAQTRKVWKDQPIGSHQAIAHPLAETWMQYEQAKLMLQKACALYDAGHRDAGSACNMAKFAAGEVAVRAADRAIQTHGGNGMSVEYGLTDLWLGARLIQIAPVSREMILNHVAQHTLGLPKSLLTPSAPPRRAASSGRRGAGRSRRGVRQASERTCGRHRSPRSTSSCARRSGPGSTTS